MWNSHFFERSDILTHQLTLDLCHYSDDCPSISLNIEIQMMLDLNIFNEGNKFMNGYQPSNLSRLITHFESQSNIIMVSSTGIFQCFVQWCHCIKSSDQYIQLLLCAKLFLASFKNPKTAFTFEVLDHFQVDVLKCKTAAINFMSKIQ
jgi:hypothetical protein